MLGDWGSNPTGGSILFISWILNNLHYINLALWKSCQTGSTKRENTNVGTVIRLFVSYLFAPNVHSVLELYKFECTISFDDSVLW